MRASAIFTARHFVIKVSLKDRLCQVVFHRLSDVLLPKGEIMSNPYNSANERASILGPTLYFKGDLSAEEDLLIQGRVEGSITHTQRLTVGPQGTVKANIKAQLIIVEGTVDGDLTAEKSVFVKETAKVAGNIFAPTVSILEGANFSGSIDMDPKKAAQAGKFDPLSRPKSAGGAA
jgi:cytoskeletal protein CcmA (bactofilin family)